jgi:hypothetical protein
LFVSPPCSLGAALEGDHCAAAIAPFHVVVSERGRQTEIHVLRTLPVIPEPSSLSPSPPLTRHIPRFFEP